MAIYSTPNDTLIGSQWHLRRHEVLRAWKMLENAGLPLGSPSVLLAVVDAPFNEHPDIPNPDIEFNTLTNSSASHSTFDPDPTGNGFYHGTDIHGVIRATRNNATGISGVAPGVHAAHISDGSAVNTFSSILEAIVKAADLGAKALNLSWTLSGDAQMAFDLDSAVAYAFNLGCLVIAAAGNEGVDLTTSTLLPGITANAVVVGGIDATDERGSWPELSVEEPGSNYGSNVDICAASKDIMLATISEAEGHAPSYEAWPGTSYAAPIVTAIVGLIHTANTDLTATQAKSILLTASDAGRNAKFSQKFPNATVVNAARAVGKALSMDPNRAGQVFPYFSFWGDGANTVATTTGTTTTLNGVVKIDLDGYAFDPVTAVELWVDGVCLYSGPPVTLTGCAANSGTPKGSAKVVVRTTTGFVEQFVTPDVVFTTLAITSHVRAPHPVPNDPYIFDLQYDGHIRSDIFRAWRTLALAGLPATGSPSVKVCIVDEGHIPHPDLPNPAPEDQYDAELGVSGEGSGYYRTDPLGRVDPYDKVHGIRVTGVIFGKANNGVGGCGVAPGVRYASINSGWAFPGYAYILDNLEGIAKAADMGSRIAACAFGHFNHPTAEQKADAQAAVDYALARDCLPFISAGNVNQVDGSTGTSEGENGDHDAFGYATSLADAVGPVSVAGTTGGPWAAHDRRSPGSCYGSKVDLAVSFSQFTTTVNPPAGDPSYEMAAGTSFSQPFVAGIGALALTANPSLTHAQLKALLRDTADRPRSDNVAFAPPFASYFPNAAGIANAGKAVAKALSMDPARAGQIFPWVVFFGSNIVDTFGTNKLQRKLSGPVSLTFGAYSSDPITAIEVWVDGLRVYNGPPTELSASASNAGQVKKTLRIISRTATASVEETLSPEVQFSSLTFATTGATANSPGANCTVTTPAPHVFVSAKKTSPGASCTVTAPAPTVTTAAAVVAPPAVTFRPFAVWDGYSFVPVQIRFFNGSTFV